MKKTRFTESQIMAVLKEVETGKTVSEVCRKHGVSDATYYVWRKKFDGFDFIQKPLLPSELYKKIVESWQMWLQKQKISIRTCNYFTIFNIYKKCDVKLVMRVIVERGIRPYLQKATQPIHIAMAIKELILY